MPTLFSPSTLRASRVLAIERRGLSLAIFVTARRENERDEKDTGTRAENASTHTHTVSARFQLNAARRRERNWVSRSRVSRDRVPFLRSTADNYTPRAVAFYRAETAIVATRTMKSKVCERTSVSRPRQGNDRVEVEERLAL